MSWLSASTYSCGGEGCLLGGGGDMSRGGILWRNLRIGPSAFNWISDSSSDGGGERDESEDSSEESSSAILHDFFEPLGVVVVVVVLGLGRFLRSGRFGCGKSGPDCEAWMWREM